MTHPVPAPLRNLVIVCGDQLDHASAALEGFDPARDAILISEAREEASYIWQHKRRLALFFSAMRHFAHDQRALGRAVIYNFIESEEPVSTLAEGLARAISEHKPEQLVLVRPGDLRVLTALEAAANESNMPLRLFEDTHFFTSPTDFSAALKGRKRFILEDFYRAERRRTGLLMTDDGKPIGGEWNFDKENRKSFRRGGAGLVPARDSFEPDAITKDVLKLIEREFADAPGSLDEFDEPVTRKDALTALNEFVANRLPLFGTYQDAMASGESTLYHSRLSAVMNLKLISPREACDAAIQAFECGAAPINAVEGFVRQILGWREFSRGVYWHFMPDYADRNALGGELPIPDFFWTGDTEMACLSDMISRLLKTGYAHHIERLMGMGLFLMLRGTQPFAAHEWHMALYLDAIDWVSMPNMLGMSQHADGAVMGTKPYCASGAYIDRMSNYCSGCRFDPKQGTGEAACPFTSLYWDFLARNEPLLKGNRRMKFQLANLHRKTPHEVSQLRRSAEIWRTV